MPIPAFSIAGKTQVMHVKFFVSVCVWCVISCVRELLFKVFMFSYFLHQHKASTVRLCISLCVCV